MRGVSFWFLLTAAIAVTVGMVWGIHMSATTDHSLAPAHAHLNLIGGVLMAIAGLYYHSVPEAAKTRLALYHFVVATVGILLIVPGIALAISEVTEALAIVGSLIVVLGMLMFLTVVLRSRATA